MSLTRSYEVATLDIATSVHIGSNPRGLSSCRSTIREKLAIWGYSEMFDWDEENIGHIALHNVLPHEAEEAATHRPVALDVALRNGEERFVQMGETFAGRVLRVITTTRGGLIRVVTAHDVDLSKRKAYALKKGLHYGDGKDRAP